VGIILVSGLSLAELAESVARGVAQVQDWRRRRKLLNVNTQPILPFPPEEPQRPNLLQRVLSGEGQEQRTETATASRKIPEMPRSSTQVPSSSAAPPNQDSNGGILLPRVVGAQTWSLPPVEAIFDEAVEYEISYQDIRERARIIEETLASFGIEAKVREINPGPAITQFGIEPGYLNSKDPQGKARKVRVSRIVNLSNDLALALSAAPIRIEAPIPGRPYVGIEVPNVDKSLVSLRGILESDAFRKAKGALPFALGRDVAGQPVVADLAKMPHLLIAGATGSGKSVCINSIIACLLATHSPETLRLLMVDPKMVELISYNGVPHLLAPVVVDLERVVGVLSWATREMDRRYKTFSQLGVRNLDAYNELAVSRSEPTMPLIVIIIDELADLMMVAPDEIERTITRIAQMARATGIHLIIATQRPSTDVVTGLIKANFPARIAFAVTSQIDSRVILDTPGAERLLGRGDMLFMAPDSSKLHRLQGAFVSDQELGRLVRFWRGASAATEGPAGAGMHSPPSQGKPVQPPLWPEMIEIEKEAQAGSEEDDLLPQAIELVRSQGRASISLVQRRLRVGYARAARLIDLMEEQGIIGPDEGGGRSRQVLPEPTDDEL
jgi:DNA segregation ATPase FtsK/SpoIIIE, S-DNA-T family